MNTNTQTANLINSVACFLDSLVVEKIFSQDTDLNGFIRAIGELESFSAKLRTGEVTARFTKETEEAIRRIKQPDASDTITKAQALDLVKLLVSLESWSGPTKDILPDYLWLKVESQIKIFTDYILEG